MKKTIISSIMLFAFVAICFAADLTGSWRGKVTTPNGDMEITFKLKAEGDKLTGAVVSDFGEMPISEGKIKADSFYFKLDVGGNVIDQRGKFMGDSITIKTTMQGNATQSTFKRIAN